ncbi:MAG: glycogen/starch/alpha-glucan phosphorylase [Eubacteriales bacterium]
MSNPAYDRERIKKELTEKLARYFGVTPDEANREQIYKATVLTVKDILAQKRADYKEKIKKQRPKNVYYLCMEFLIGRSLKNNLMNLELEGSYRDVLAEMGQDIDVLYDMEPDPGLGNGGLGRLAACFMDSLTTLDYPATGFSICYEYGLFEQKIIDGNQVELPDVWMPYGDVWLAPRTDKACTVRFGGHVQESWADGHCTITHTDYDEVQAVPYDMFISGSDCQAVNKLRLWRAHNTTNFNMNLFSQGQYVQALQKNTDAEVISKVLYPSDDHDEGKLLRLSQQYFLVSASLQNIISDHLNSYGSLYNFADKVAIHINDTHPALCIPELMRILMDVYSYSWESAWSIVTRVVSYTNHTVLPEALEKWNVDLFRLKLPRIYMIVEEINRRLCADLWNMYPGDWDRISRMAVVGYSQIRMANLSVAGSHTVNGVSKLHSEILKKSVFHDYYKAMPYKFTNVTNGIAHRRWLCYSNPGLSALLDETIGTDYRHDPEKLNDFATFAEDASVRARLRAIKAENKRTFAAKLLEKRGITVDPASIFDVQVKRMHEYKRQLLNVLKIVAYLNELRDHPNADVAPTTFIFGGKAAPGYYMAKDIIKLIWSLGQEIERDPKLREIIRVVYLEDYNVSTAEILMPASDISEQISLAGKEASGTGCMKFMINGALTIGTMDGANVEMADAVGMENIYIFGLRAEEVDELWKNGYSSLSYYQGNERLRGVMDTLGRGFAGNSFSNIVGYLLYGHGISDPYMCLADFDSYFATSEAMRRTYADTENWTRKSLINIARAGHFAADRSIREYAENIWHITPIL